MNGNRIVARGLVLPNARAHADRELAELAQQQGRAVAVSRRVARLTAIGAGVVCQEIGTVADGLLDLDVTELLLHGWQRHREVRSAKAWTRENPNAEVVVTLATHSWTSAYRPSVEVLVEDVRVATVDLEIRLAVTANGVLAVVRRGAVAEVRAGRLEVVGTFSCERVVISERRTSFDVPGTLRWVAEPAPQRVGADGRIRSPLSQVG